MHTVQTLEITSHGVVCCRADQLTGAANDWVIAVVKAAASGLNNFHGLSNAFVGACSKY
jgi:hypothetical protein